VEAYSVKLEGTRVLNRRTSFVSNVYNWNIYFTTDSFFIFALLLTLLVEIDAHFETEMWWG